MFSVKQDQQLDSYPGVTFSVEQALLLVPVCAQTGVRVAMLAF